MSAQDGGAFIDARQDNPGSNAAKNIVAIINAAADAHQAQTELQKQIMLKQIGDKMELSQNKAKLQQGVESNINQKNANVNWLESMGGQDAPAAQTGNGLGSSGVADSGTPAAQSGGDAFSMSAPQPQTPAPSPTPMLNAGAQRPNNPALNGIVPQAPTTAGVTAPQPQAPSQQYTNLGYKPIEAPQILAERQKNGQSPNFSDTAYVQALNKVKAGTASEGEIAMVNKMNNNESGLAPVHQQISKVQSALRNMENIQGLPSGSLWMNPSTGEPEMNPIAKSRIEARQRAEEAYAVTSPDRLEKQNFEMKDKIDKNINPTNAPTRSVLGLIGQTTVRAQRAIDQLKPGNMITPQMLSGISSDMAGILQGGAPTQIGMNEQEYGTLQNTVAKGIQYLTANPQSALPEQIRKQLLSSFEQLNDTGKSFIANNIKTYSRLHADWIAKNPDTWQGVVDSINEQYGVSGEKGKLASGDTSNGNVGNDELQALLAEKARRSGGK